MITVKEIAKRCGVSPSTVSNILNGKTNVSQQTRQKVLACVAETGYQPNYFAQSIRKQGNRVISIITEDLAVFGTNPIVESMMGYCEDNNYRTVLMNLRLYQKWKSTWYGNSDLVKTSLYPYIQEALSIKVSGIIYTAGHCRLIDYFPENLSIPVVIAYALSHDNRYTSIVIDDELGGYDSTKHLIEKGHSKIGVIAGIPDNLHTKQRLLGYQKALFENAILYDPSLIVHGDWKRGSGYDGARNLLSRDITAIFCMNDVMAAGAYDYLFERGLSVGSDISIIGYDNMELSDYMRPRLTTAGIQLSDIGRIAAENMIRILEDGQDSESKPAIVKVPCKLYARESVQDLGNRDKVSQASLGE